jgi:hypothetical protein
MKPLLSTSQLAAVQAMVDPNEKVQITIFRPAFTEGIYGDDARADVEVETVWGWLFSTPVNDSTQEGGRKVTVQTHRLWVPVATDIIPNDRVTILGDSYQVIDIRNATWQEALEVTIRRQR